MDVSEAFGAAIAFPPSPFNLPPLSTSLPFQPPSPFNLPPLSTSLPFQPPSPFNLPPLSTSFPFQPPSPFNLPPLSTSLPFQPPSPFNLSPLSTSFPSTSLSFNLFRLPSLFQLTLLFFINHSSSLLTILHQNFFVVYLLNEVEQKKVEDLIKSKLVFSRPTGFDPAVTVYNVPSDLTEGELSDALAAKNSLLFASGEKERLKVCRRFRNSRGNCDVVVRMAPVKHRQLGEKMDKRVFLLFSAHLYKNMVQTFSCFKCFCYGHTDSKGICKNSRVSGRCGEKDHVAANCTSRAKCVNCMRSGRGRSAEGHTATDSGCPVYARHLAITRARSAY